MQAQVDSNLGADLVNPSSDLKDVRKRYVPVPSDETLKNQPCPICHDKFEIKYSDEAQDFVWVDAIKVGNRIYHASCHHDLKRDGTSTPLGSGRIGTPDSVLGKRKAEG